MSIQSISTYLSHNSIKHSLVIAKTSNPVLDLCVKTKQAVDRVDARKADIITVIKKAHKQIESLEEQRPELSLELYQNEPSTYKIKLNNVIKALSTKAQS